MAFWPSRGNSLRIQTPLDRIGLSWSNWLATSHDRFSPNGGLVWFSKGNPLISGKSRLVKYYNLAKLRIPVPSKKNRILGCNPFPSEHIGGFLGTGNFDRFFGGMVATKNGLKLRSQAFKIARVDVLSLKGTHIWPIYNDLSRGHLKWWFSKGIPPKMALN